MRSTVSLSPISLKICHLSSSLIPRGMIFMSISFLKILSVIGKMRGEATERFLIEVKDYSFNLLNVLNLPP